MRARCEGGGKRPSGTGHRYHGTGPMAFRLRDGRIADLRIG
ncbi:hypothetical protein ACWEVY_34845 [Streptomyces longwoodensis]